MGNWQNSRNILFLSQAASHNIRFNLYYRVTMVVEYKLSIQGRCGCYTGPESRVCTRSPWSPCSVSTVLAFDFEKIKGASRPAHQQALPNECKSMKRILAGWLLWSQRKVKVCNSCIVLAFSVFEAFWAFRRFVRVSVQAPKGLIEIERSEKLEV